ncbi:RidA family protein [Polycladospora coralii]|uniref:RidA family protein n=1 Tax=Polycladospora coralii TaxID=2771432 RepID=UPI0020BF256D|nr:Rid family hydrolase [Polycladospora coralii]
MISRTNPRSVPAPIGDYAHLTVVPTGADLLVLAGQVAILASENVDVEHVIKVNLWFTSPIDRALFQKIWRQFHQGSPPATTLAYVSALAQPHIQVEVEVWAARYPA